jgi:hypothetical protein
MTDAPIRTYLIEMSTAAKRRAMELARARNDASQRKGSMPGHGGPAQGSREALDKNILGAFGEFVVALFLGYPEPATIDAYHAPDLPGGEQVRTRDPRRGLPKCDHLIVRRDDSPTSPYVLVLLESPQLRIMGWLRGADAMRERFLFGYGSRPKQFFVPPKALTDAENLRPDRPSPICTLPMLTHKDIQW